MYSSFTFRFLTLLATVVLLMTSAQAKNAEFPGRDKYPTIPFIEIADLQKMKNDVVFVDVRSNYEFKTLRITGAYNIPISSPNFAEEMRTLSSINKGKKLVVYCNGKTCMKSYKAVLKCKRAKINNVISYDAGIMDWARKYPADAVLLGESPVDTTKIISKKTFKTHLLSPKQFEDKLDSNKILILDVRDRYQRDATGLFPGKESRVYINDATGLDKHIAKANAENKTLMIYDEVGKQVRWLQYYLERKNASSYYFMEGGVRSYYKYISSLY